MTPPIVPQRARRELFPSLSRKNPWEEWQRRDDIHNVHNILSQNKLIEIWKRCVVRGDRQCDHKQTSFWSSIVCKVSNTQVPRCLCPRSRRTRFLSRESQDSGKKSQAGQSEDEGTHACCLERSFFRRSLVVMVMVVDGGWMLVDVCLGRALLYMPKGGSKTSFTPELCGPGWLSWSILFPRTKQGVPQFLTHLGLSSTQLKMLDLETFST